MPLKSFGAYIPVSSPLALGAAAAGGKTAERGKAGLSCPLPRWLEAVSPESAGRHQGLPVGGPQSLQRPEEAAGPAAAEAGGEEEGVEEARGWQEEQPGEW